jgi:hypothetical protein
MPIGPIAQLVRTRVLSARHPGIGDDTLRPLAATYSLPWSSHYFVGGVNAGARSSLPNVARPGILPLVDPPDRECQGRRRSWRRCGHRLRLHIVRNMRARDALIIEFSWRRLELAAHLGMKDPRKLGITIPAIWSVAVINGEPPNASCNNRSPRPGSSGDSCPVGGYDVLSVRSGCLERLSGLADESTVAGTVAHLGLLVKLTWS